MAKLASNHACIVIDMGIQSLQVNNSCAFALVVNEMTNAI